MALLVMEQKPNFIGGWIKNWKIKVWEINKL